MAFTPRPSARRKMVGTAMNLPWRRRQKIWATASKSGFATMAAGLRPMSGSECSIRFSQRSLLARGRASACRSATISLSSNMAGLSMSTRNRVSTPSVHRIPHRSAKKHGYARQDRSIGVKLLILVVDDEPDVEMLFRQQFRRDLRAGRFTMEFAQSAPAALQCIGDARDTSLILILSDINMPGMSGLELLPKAKAVRPDVPVIMITAYGDAETKRKALESGAEALFTKPIDFVQLRSEIDTRVERAA